MSEKSKHYHNAVNRIHLREIEEYEPGVIFEEYKDFTLRITDGVVCVQSKLKFSPVIDEVDDTVVEQYYNCVVDAGAEEVQELDGNRQSIVTLADFRKQQLTESLLALMSFCQPSPHFV